MKIISSTIRGLSSSLLLNVGLTALAQKFDPVSQGDCEICPEASGVSACTICNFPARQRK